MMRRRILRAAASIALAGGLWLAGPAAATPLKDAVRLATERDPLIAALQQSVARETTGIEAARDGKRPQVSLSGAVDSDNDPAVVLTVTQVLFDWGLVKSRVAQASQNRVKVVAEMKMAVEDLTLQVSELYIEVETLDRKIGRTADYIGFASRIETHSRNRVAAGLTDSSEIARARLEISRAEQRMRQLRADRQLSVSQLEFLVGRSMADARVPPALSFSEKFSRSAAVIEAVMLAPAYVAAKADVEIAAAGIRVAKAASRPTISLQAQGRQDLTGGRGRSGSIGLTAGVDLNAGSFRGRAVLAAEQEHAAAEHRLRAVERELQNTARVYTDTIRVLRADEASQQQQLLRAREVLEVYEQQFIGGRKDLIDLLTTGRDLYDSEIDEIETYKERKYTEYVAAHSVGMLGSLLFEAR